MADGHRATVLVVDDEAFVRMDLVDTLKAAGYRTREAGCAAEAIEMLEQDPDITVVFTDIQMPGSMDGLALYRYVRERWPPTSIVICSGNRRPAQDDLPIGADFIAKPFGRHEVSRILEKIRSRPSTS
jgi:CheY-like chemotaxis protein